MRSLLVTERYLPHQGGSRRYYHELAKRLENCRVVTGREPASRAFDAASPVQILRRPGVRFDYRRKWYHTRNAHLNFLLVLVPQWLATLFWTLWEIVWRRPAVIHAGGYLFPGVAARLLGPRLRIPYVVYAHGEEIASAVKTRHFLRCLLWVCRGAEATVANCRNTARMLIERGLSAEKIVIGYPGVDPSRATPREGDARKRLGIRGEPVLLSVGRLAAHKGFGGVIQALPRLRRRWPGIVYCIAGAEGEESKLRALAGRMQVEESVRWLGLLGDEELRDAYAAADLFVQPNGEVAGVSEGYGMVYLEAGAAGLAVIGGRSGGVVESVQDGVTGILVTPFSEDELVAAVSRLLEDPGLRRKMGEAGRRLAGERTWDATLAPVIELDRALKAARDSRRSSRRNAAAIPGESLRPDPLAGGESPRPSSGARPGG